MFKIELFLKTRACSIARCMSILCILFITACLTENRREKTANECGNNECILNFCSNYDINSNEITDENNIICYNGTCSLPEMPLYSQLNINVPNRDIACGPTTIAMVMDSILNSKKFQTEGWTQKYSQINEKDDPTKSSTTCPASDVECKKIVSSGTKLINTSWTADSAYPVYSSEVNKFWTDRKNEFTSTESLNYDSGDYPESVNKCSFVSGETAITNTEQWANVVLYLKYSSSNDNSNKMEDGTLVTNITIYDEPITGHYIALNGYDATGTELFYKFNDPTLGYKWYTIKEIVEGKPFCAAWKNDICLQYIVVNKLPSGFVNKAAYLVETTGEELKKSYQFKFIANIGGFKP